MNVLPYFETELGRIYHGDCLEIMQEMKDDSIDLILTDPPYGISYLSNYYKNKNPFGKIKNDEKYPIYVIPILKKLAKKAVFCFCRWDNLFEVEKPKSFIVWAKNNWTAGDLLHEYGRSWEGILFYPLQEHSFKKRLPDLIDFRRIPPTKLHHPTEKPKTLISWIIENNSDTNDIIFDPFIGSGTTAIACERLNRRWIGIEISKEYCDIAVDRIKKETAQLKLSI